MSKPQWFWLFLTIACVAWYALVTVYVAVRGGMDIRGMLRRLAEDHTPKP